MSVCVCVCVNKSLWVCVGSALCLPEGRHECLCAHTLPRGFAWMTGCFLPPTWQLSAELHRLTPQSNAEHSTSSYLHEARSRHFPKLIFFNGAKLFKSTLSLLMNLKHKPAAGKRNSKFKKKFTFRFLQLYWYELKG